MNPRVLLLPVGAFALGTGNFVFVGVLDALARDLGVAVAAAGQLTTVFAVAYALSAPLLVAVTTRFPRRRVMVLGLALFSGANAAMALAPALGWLLGLRALAAFGAALYMPVAMGAAVSLVDPAHRGRAMSVVLLGLTAALLAGVPAGTWIGAALGWRATFVFAALLGLVAIAAVAAGVPALPGTVSRGLRGLGVIARAAVAGNLAITALAFVAVFSVNAYIGPVVTGATGLGAPGIGAMQILLGVGSVLGVPLGGWIADRRPTLGVVAAIVAALVAAQPVYSLLMIVPGWAGTTAAVVATGTAMLVASAVLFALGPIQQQRLITVAGDERDIVLSLNAAALFLGQGLGAAVGGLATRAFSLAAIGLAGGAVALAGLLPIALLLARRGAARMAAADGDAGSGETRR